MNFLIVFLIFSLFPLKIYKKTIVRKMGDKFRIFFYFFSVVARDLCILYFHPRYLIHYLCYHITVVTYTLNLWDLWRSSGGYSPHTWRRRLLNHLVCVELSKFVEVMRCWRWIMRVFLSLRGLAVHRSRLWLASHALAQVSGTHHVVRWSWPCDRSKLPPLGAQEVPPEWVSNCVYFLLAVLQEYIYSISCLSLLITRDLFGSCPGLLGVGEQGGALGGSLGAQAVRDSPAHL